MRNRAHDEPWYRDVRTLWRRPLEFFPTRDQSHGERLNSMVRLTLYCSLALLAYSRKAKYAALGVLIVVLASVAFAMRPTVAGRYVPVGSPLALVTEADSLVESTLPGASAAAATAATSRGSRGSVRGSRRGSRRGEGMRSCTWSTPNNPFANPLPTDYADDPLRPPACAYDDMKRDIRKNFNRGLVRSSLDVFEKENSQRQYYTMPTTTTFPDTKAFANFLGVTRKTCKEDTSLCTGHRG